MSAFAKHGQKAEDLDEPASKIVRQKRVKDRIQTGIGVGKDLREDLNDHECLVPYTAWVGDSSERETDVQR